MVQSHQVSYCLLKYYNNNNVLFQEERGTNVTIEKYLNKIGSFIQKHVRRTMRSKAADYVETFY